jgi:hypothetical protein
MHAPIQALGRELWWRHRWGLSVSLAYLLMAVVFFRLLRVEDLAWSLGNIVLPGALAQRALRVEDITRFIGFVTASPVLMGMLLYLVRVFSYGLQVDLKVKDSHFPPRLFLLPVRTRALVSVPMILGTGAVALTWVALEEGVLRPCGFRAPLALLALLAASILAWIQALSWSPFGAGWLRVITTVVVLSVLIAIAIVGSFLEVSPTLLLSLFAGSLPVAYGVAVIGVSRARRGDSPEWYRWANVLRRIASWLPRRGRPFASAAGAQVWFEWHTHGILLPFLVGLLLPWVLLLFLIGDGGPSVSMVLLFVALLPPLMAGIAGATVSKPSPWVKDKFGVSAITALRPLTCGALVAAKLRMGVLSTLVTWALILIVVPVAVAATGFWPEVSELWRNGQRLVQPPQFAAGVSLGLAGLIFLTWRNLVGNLFIGLTGRAWVITSNLFLGAGGLAALGTLGVLLNFHPDYQARFLAMLPWLLGGAVLFKLLAATWAGRAVTHRGLVEKRTLAWLLGLWLTVAVMLAALLCWLDPGQFLAAHTLVLGVILYLPLTRLLAAPLALAWNRHR